MALSTASSIPPLSDRSNAFLDAFPTTLCSPTPSRHTDSKRYLFPHLDSSEATPSENGSVFDTKPARASDSRPGAPPEKRVRSRSRPHSRSLPEEQSPPLGSPNGAGVAVRFINRPDATPLTTIIEQKSIATLRSARSLAAAPNLTTSKDGNRHAEETEQKQPSRDHAGRRQAALTIDEVTLMELHAIIENQVPANEIISSASASECVNAVPDLTRPISPPHSPPVRAQTPCGLPRWPGDLPTSIRSPPRRVSRTRSFGTAVRDFFRGPRGELEGRNLRNRTTQSGVGERLQLHSATPSNHRIGLSFWRPPTSGHGTSNLPGWFTTEPGMHEVTAETNSPCDPSAPEQEPGTRSRLHGRNEKRNQESAQREPLQPQDRQGPVQAPMSGSAPPKVAQAGRSQASRRPSTPTGRQQECLPADDAGRTGSPSSVYSTPTRTGRNFNHPLIPAPLFASPPHSRRDLDPRIPVSPYDRLTHVLNTGQLESEDPLVQTCSDHSGPDTSSRCTVGSNYVCRSSSASTRTIQSNSVESRRMISTESNTPPSTCASIAAASSRNLHAPLSSVRGSRVAGSPRSSMFSTTPRSQLQTKQSKVERKPCGVTTSMGFTVIRSAALPALLPIAAAEGIVRPRPLPRPVTYPLTEAQLSRLPDKSKGRRRSLSAVSISAMIRDVRGSNSDANNRDNSSESYHTAAQTPKLSRASNFPTLSSNALAPLSLDQVLADAVPFEPMPRGVSMGSRQQRRNSNGNAQEEKGVGELLGWLLRICFCQPVGGVEDWEGGGDNARRHLRIQRNMKQGSEARYTEAQQESAA